MPASGAKSWLRRVGEGLGQVVMMAWLVPPSPSRPGHKLPGTALARRPLALVAL